MMEYRSMGEKSEGRWISLGFRDRILEEVTLCQDLKGKCGIIKNIHLVYVLSSWHRAPENPWYFLSNRSDPQHLFETQMHKIALSQ